MKNTLTLTILKLLFLFQLFLPNLSLHCSSACTYTQTTSSTINPQCSGGSNAYSSSCTSCDWNIYKKLSGTVCTPQDKFNTTFTFSSINWTISSGIATSATWESDPDNTWMRMDPDVYVRASVHWATLFARYGFQCRILFAIPSSTSVVDEIIMTVKYNSHKNNDTRTIPILPLSLTGYTERAWIYTTPFYYTTDNNFITLQLTKSVNIGGDYFYFKDLRCLSARCVQNCLSCTSLTTCTKCSPGFVLDKNNHCYTNCATGQFIDSVTDSANPVCSSCLPTCRTCTTNNFTCTSCTQSGVHQTFLFTNQTCLPSCPLNYTHNYSTHKCDCPSQNYFIPATLPNQCHSCHVGCKICLDNTLITCSECNYGYYLIQPFSSTTCNQVCPAGQFASQLIRAKCFYCDTLLCQKCVNSNSTCTSCHPATGVWLSNNTCITSCPPGYEADNTTYKCVQCTPGTFSFLGKCISDCPQYYQKDPSTGSCIIANGGYPISLIFEVENSKTLKFTIDLELGLQTALLTTLNTTWATFIELYYSVFESSSIVTGPKRLLQSLTSPITISNAVITNTSIVLYTNAIDVSSFKHSHQFIVKFVSNLVSPNNTMYSITSKNSTDTAPWVLRQYFQLNKKPFYLISIIYFLAALIPLLMRIKNGYQILMQYYQCIQLAGLSLYGLYPYISSVDLYSFVTGLDFANFSFMINVPVKYIPVCLECQSFSSYSFVLGDMNWLKIIGSLLICLVVMLLLIIIVYAFVISREYSFFLVKLTVDLVIIKCIHAWFGSLVYAGLNLNRSQLNDDVYITLMHTLSYILLIPLFYVKVKNSHQQKYPILCQIFMLFNVMLITIMPVGPLLICSLLMFSVCFQWCYHMFTRYLFMDKVRIAYGDGYGEERREGQNVFLVDGETLDGGGCGGMLPDFYFHILRSLRPMTVLLIICMMMIEQQIATITFVSLIFGIYLILILVLFTLCTTWNQYKLKYAQNYFIMKQMTQNKILKQKKIFIKMILEKLSVSTLLVNKMQLAINLVQMDFHKQWQCQIVVKKAIQNYKIDIFIFIIHLLYCYIIILLCKSINHNLMYKSKHFDPYIKIYKIQIQYFYNPIYSPIHHNLNQ